VEPAPAADGMLLDDPLSTKLDLAKVYLDMGDRDGAREYCKTWSVRRREA
jgi:pilus assembly protein FimV